MKPTKLCLLLLAANAVSCARIFPVAFAQPLPERRVLSGRVTNDAGNPLPRVNITIQRENDLGAYAFWGTVAVTDAQGRYRIDNAEEGSYLISAEADSFANVQNQHLRIDANSNVWNVQLQRLTRLRLKLKNANGDLVPNASPALRLNKTFGGSKSIGFARRNQPRVQTNERGELEIPDVEPGTYQLEIALPGVGFARIDAFEVPYEAQPVAREVPLQRGGNVTFIAREAIAGENNESNDNGRLLGGAILTLGEDVQPTDLEREQGVLVRQGTMDLGSLYAWSSDGSRAVTSDGDGVLALQDLAPGRYTARLILPGHTPSAAQNFEIKRGQTQTLTFALQSRGPAVSGAFVVQDGTGAPIVNRDWTLQLRFLQPLTRAPKDATPVPDTVIIAPPEANLAIPLPDAPPFEAAPFEAAPLPPGIEEMALQNEMLSFSGVVTRRAHSDAKGQFTLYPLQPGRWMLTMFATPQGDSVPRGPIAQQMISIDANSNAPITLQMK